MNYLRNFLHFRLILPLQRYVIIIIFAVARNILQHLNERRKLHTLKGGNFTLSLAEMPRVSRIIRSETGSRNSSSSKYWPFQIKLLRCL